MAHAPLLPVPEETIDLTSIARRQFSPAADCASLALLTQDASRCITHPGSEGKSASGSGVSCGPEGDRQANALGFTCRIRCGLQSFRALDLQVPLCRPVASTDTNFARE